MQVQEQCVLIVQVMDAAQVYVYHGTEVNLVGMSINTTFPNNIRAVVPFVALDTVSYSSYDTESLPYFGMSNVCSFTDH